MPPASAGSRGSHPSASHGAATLAQLLERSAGIEAHHHAQFFEPGTEAAIGEATFQNHYWED